LPDGTVKGRNYGGIKAWEDPIVLLFEARGFKNCYWLQHYRCHTIGAHAKGSTYLYIVVVLS